MEAAAAWDGPGQFQLANWSVEEPVFGLPLEYESIVDIPASAGGLEAYEEYEDVELQQQLVEYYSAASRRPSFSMSIEEAKISNDDCARSVVKQVVDEFAKDMSMMGEKMHRYPAYLGDVDKCYTTPRIVAIGPYHHGLEHLKPAEKAKHAAACHCIGDVQLLEEIYQKFIKVADRARDFYDNDVMAGISYDDFRHMMFFDACFLVMYVAMRSSSSRRDIIDKNLQGFMRPNRIDIFHDIMLLENQIPWTVVKEVMSFLRHDVLGVPSKSIPINFVYRLKDCMLPDDRRLRDSMLSHDRPEPPEEQPSFKWNDEYEPPHLLGLLHYYIVGQRSNVDTDPEQETKNMAFAVSSRDLTEIGITLKANKTMRLIDMHLKQKGAVFSELSLAPLSLDRDRASHLLNMAAFELRTIESFGSKKAKDEDSAVFSYVMLLANLLCGEEEVQELREKSILQRGGGLTNAEVLRFFMTFQSLRFGPCYYRIMVQIENYRNSHMTAGLHAFIHNNKKTIYEVVSGIPGFGWIIGTLLSIKKSI